MYNVYINGGKMEKEYEKFIVHQLDDNYSMIHIEIKDNEEFYKSLFECFFTEEMIKILNEEYTIEEKNGKLKVRIDKIGKIGEYIFTCILNEYFKFQCILPKVHLQTSYNMSIYGIDTLFYSKDKEMLLFGEWN